MLKTLQTFKNGKLISSETIEVPDPTISDMLSVTEQPGVVARKVEDVISKMIDGGTSFQPEVVKWVSDRKKIRGEQ